MKFRLATAGLLALAVLASTLSLDVADPEPASAHTKHDCTWVTSTNWGIIGYTTGPYEQSFTDGHDTSGPTIVPVYGYKKYQSCSLPIARSHWFRNLVLCSTAGVVIAVLSPPAAALLLSAGGAFACGVIMHYLPEGYN